MNIFGHIWGKLSRLQHSIWAHQAKPDDCWAHKYLISGEYSVFMRMDPRDRAHGIRVAQTLLKAHPDAEHTLIAAALLHDCGKCIRPYRVWERVCVGLIPYAWGYHWSWQPIVIRFRHPQLGAELIEQAEGRPQVANWVRQHHSPNCPESTLLYQFDHLE